MNAIRSVLRDPQNRGLATALLCGIVLGSAVSVSRYAFDGGASGIVVAAIRAAFMVVVFAAGLRLAGRSFQLPRKLMPLVLANGILMGLMTFGNIGAVEFISVGLAALLFYTFPVLIALLVIVFGIERVSVVKLLAIGLAFIGLAIMLGESLGGVDGRGVALSLMGSLATAINAVLVGRYFKGFNVFLVILYFSVVAFVFLLILATFAAPVRLPHSAIGWSGTLGVAILQTIGTPLYFFAIGRIGALKTAMATNIQPVTSIVQAWVLFGELLTLLQALGGAIVLLAIAFMQWWDLRKSSHAKRS